MPQIKVEEISYRYPVGEEAGDERNEAGTCVNDIKALDKVSLGVEEGQFICILGSNGSGKSTLARHLNALLLPDKGSVWINGMNTHDDEHLWDIRMQVGMVFQNPDNQMVAVKVDEEVAFGLENMGVDPEQMVVKVREALKKVGMEDYADENPAYLSGGQKQRIAVAGIAAMKPKCIVMDESTSMLDPQGRKEIMDTVIRLNREQGITLICITHFMEEALEADRVFVMDKGRIVMSGTPREILGNKEKLEKASLTLPVILTIIDKLRERGLKIPEEIITSDELVNYLNERK